MDTVLLAFFDEQLGDLDGLTREVASIIPSIQHEIDLDVTMALEYLADLTTVLARVQAKVLTLQEQLEKMKPPNEVVEEAEPDVDLTVIDLLLARDGTSKADIAVADGIEVYGHEQPEKAAGLLSEASLQMITALTFIANARGKDPRLGPKK